MAAQPSKVAITWPTAAVLTEIGSCMYEDEARSDFDVFLKACGISHGKGAHVQYIGDQFFTPTISTNTS